MPWARSLWPCDGAPSTREPLPVPTMAQRSISTMCNPREASVPGRSYGRSKLCNIMFTRELAHGLHGYYECRETTPSRAAQDDRITAALWQRRTQLSVAASL